MIRSSSTRKSASTGFALAWKASIVFSPVAIIVNRAFSWLTVRGSIRAVYACYAAVEAVHGLPPAALDKRPLLPRRKECRLRS